MDRLHHPELVLSLALAASVTWATGCAVEQAPTRDDVLSETFEAPASIVRTTWSEAAAEGRVPVGWLTSFNDPEMESLVGEALRNNLALRGAAAQVDVAAGLAEQAAAGLRPAVGVSAGGSGVRFEGSDLTSNSNVGIGASWELDVWGRLRAAAAAGEAQFEAAEADYDFARESLAAQTAKAWYLASEATQQEALATELVEITGRLIELVELKHDAGQVAQQDIRLARADLASAEDARRSLTTAREQAVRALELLLGRYPGADLEVRDDFVPVPPPTPAGAPSELLERRADLLAAERRVDAAFRGVEVARLARLPRVSLTANAGALSNDLAQLLNLGPGFFNVGANFFAPIDTTGALQAQVEIATAQQDQALAAYGQRVLVAFSEVETALSNERLLLQRRILLESAVEDNAKALELTRVQYEVGRIDLLSVLQVQSRWVSARASRLRIQSALLTNRINLHLALGGGFESADATDQGR